MSNINNEDLVRYNKSYQVFRNLRGTAPYYEHSKMNLMALIRQLGCPSLFLTLSCAEFDWFELLKEIAETVYRREFSNEEIEQMSDREKNKLIADNIVQSTLHYNKRFQKLFSLMRSDFFKSEGNCYFVSHYYFRIEFQMRGAPHVHSLLWLKDSNGKDAPSFWSKEENEDEIKFRFELIEKFTDMLVSTSPDDMHCEDQLCQNLKSSNCNQCDNWKEKAKKYQSHNHTATCLKTGKLITIKKNEGHGWLDGIAVGEELKNIPLCRFRFPHFPLDKTTLVVGISKNTNEDILKTRKADLRKIITFLIRQSSDAESFLILKNMSFYQFLHYAGMYEEHKSYNEYSNQDKIKARTRYLNALSASVVGSAKVFLKRKVEHIFVNGFNKKIMLLFQANHDLQLCIDPYACVQYVSKYITKNEAGKSQLLMTVCQETLNLKQIDQLRALATVLDKHREASLQECVYRILGLQMAKSSVKVKYISTNHPHYRDGLLKGNIEELEEDESVFHLSPHQYYEFRPTESSQEDKISYVEEELEDDYWSNLCLAEFWSKYEIVYGKPKLINKKRKTKIIPLKDGKGFIRRRSEMAVLRFYLNYSNDEDLARGLLILYLPFRNEAAEIHQKDVKLLLQESRTLIEEKRTIFEKYKNMSDLIAKIQSEASTSQNDDDVEELDVNEIETTSTIQIEEFNKAVRAKALKDLTEFKHLTTVIDISELRLKLSSLNYQQRLIFDDVVERMASSEEDEFQFYLFLTGNAGTGKSYLLRLIIDAVKLIKIKAGDDLKKPPLIVMAPTANAAHIVGGKTIDSVLGFLPGDKNRYIKTSESRMATLKHNFEDVSLVICDEISMVGSSKLLKINFRLQDISEGAKSKMYMGGKSFIASGTFQFVFFIEERFL